jgi:cytidyltransferase-like protein
MKKSMVFGTFDILHKGHLSLFNQAKKQGYLIAVVARNDTVKKVKGKFPHYSEKERLKHVSVHADKAVLGYKTDKFKIIEKFKPDVICLGYDQNSFTKELRKELKKRKIKAKIIRLMPYKPNLYKSSLLKL